MAAKKKDPGTVNVPVLKTDIIRLRIEGSTSLIVHNFGEKGKQQMRDQQAQVAKMKKAAKDPVACFESAKYVDSKGRDCVKGKGIKLAMVAAARFCDGLAMTTLYQTIFVLGGELLPLEFAECVMREDVVRVGTFPNKTTDLRYRPEYFGWAVEFDVEYNPLMVSPDQLLNLAQIAGFHVGLFEWRPEKKGDHGRFVAKLLTKKVVTDDSSKHAAE